MSSINYAKREISCKIVYCGPALGGKTTNMKYIYDSTSPDTRGKMISSETESDRTLSFDFVPLGFGEMRGFKLRFHLHTVPGQVASGASRKLILNGADGIVFIADSQPGRMADNQKSMDDLRNDLEQQGCSLDRIPFVIQYNKQDLPEAVPWDELNALLNTAGVPAYRGVATTGVGVLDVFKGIAKQIAVELKKRG